MQTPNGHGSEDSIRKAGDTRNVSKINVLLTPSQAQLISWVSFHGVMELCGSLKLIHDLALYHTEVPLGEDEKDALFELKLLWEGFARIGMED